MNFNKGLKLIVAKMTLLFALVAIFSSCESYDEEPDIRGSIGTKTGYIMPSGDYMSDSERAIVKQRNEEYKEALGIN